MPPSATDLKQYDGEMIRELQQKVIEAERAYVATVSLKPWEILAHACGHICNRVMSAGDVQAWFLLKERIDLMLLED